MNGKLVLNSLKGMAIGLGTALVLMLLLNFIALKGSDPDKPLSVFAYVAEGIGAAVSGFAASKINKERGIEVGGIAGAMYACLLVLGGLVTGGSIRFGAAVIVSIASVLISGLFGIIGLPGEKSSNARRRDMMRKFG